MDFLSEKYSSTFKNPTEGYYEFFRKTEYFVSDIIPIEYAFMKQMGLEDITCHYYPHINNVKFLLTKYSMKTIVSSYAKKREKTCVIGTLMDMGYSIDDIKKEKIYLSKKQHDELFGW